MNIFFAQNDPPSTLDGNKTKPSEVSNPEDSGPFSRNDSFDRKSENLKKESVNKTKEEEMTSEFDINNIGKIENTLDSKKIESAPSNDKINNNNKNFEEEILKKEMDNSRNVNSRDLKERENLKEEKKEQEKSTKKIEEFNNENSEDHSNRDIPQEEKESPLIINDKEKLSERESAQDLLKTQKEEILRGTDNGSDVKNVIKHEDNIDLTEIPKDIFSKEKYGYHCKDINLVKKMYEAQESFPKTESYLKNQCCKNVPGSLTIRNLIIKSFKSYSKYKIWIHNI